MTKILLTGIATLDIINHVDHYPIEDEELRASSQQISRGGNAANTAVVLSQLNHQCQLATTLADDSAGTLIIKDLKKFNVSFNSELTIKNSSTPTSYITVNKNNGSRTIVHYRNLPELTFEQFDKIKLSDFDWFHFEGRNINQTYKMIKKIKHNNKMISLEIEKERKDFDQLFPLADILMISKPFAQNLSFDSAKECLNHFAKKYPHALISCTWGKQGAWLIQNNSIFHSPAFIADKIIDTIGAGDTYNAGLIHSIINNTPLDKAIEFACKLAGKKCAQSGFNQPGKL